MLAIVTVILVGSLWLYWSGKIPNTRIYKTIVELVPKSESDYNRQIVGKYLSLDRDRGTMKLEGYDGEIYYLSVPMVLIKNNDDDINIKYNAKVQVRWRDSNSMEELEARYRDNPKAPMNADASTLSISK